MTSRGGIDAGHTRLQAHHMRTKHGRGYSLRECSVKNGHEAFAGHAQRREHGTNAAELQPVDLGQHLSADELDVRQCFFL